MASAKGGANCAKSASPEQLRPTHGGGVTSVDGVDVGRNAHVHTGHAHGHPLAILPVGEFSGGADDSFTPSERLVGRSPHPASTSGTEQRGVQASGDNSQSDAPAAMLERRDGGAVDSNHRHGAQRKPAAPARDGEWALASLPAGSFGMSLAHGALVPAVPAVPFRFLPPNQVCLAVVGFCTQRLYGVEFSIEHSLLSVLVCFFRLIICKLLLIPYIHTDIHTDTHLSTNTVC